MKSVHAPFEAILRTLDSQLDDFRERRVAAASAESHQEPPSETTSAENDTDGPVRSGPYLRSASEPTPTPTPPCSPPESVASTDSYLRNSWLARASE
ncbi:hypothetical protein C1M55_09610 [Rhodococcus qingshengii]|uniref:hypothetical protein n=1 Tax=Rhodococcus qingshengii TaxID=334542 RepID=UPI000C9ED77D|nr:hypothetical protein [Rhodococcus qingshengii]AUS31344.1 hypothetical protein C1M55_09610 [Rhodococcus qingshengii]